MNLCMIGINGNFPSKVFKLLSDMQLSLVNLAPKITKNNAHETIMHN